MKNITDEEIQKALEYCSSDEIGICHLCPLEGECNGDATYLLKFALDLINRQKAEIERLQKAGEEAVSCFRRMESLYNIKRVELKVAKAEAIKEFAERLKVILAGYECCFIENQDWSARNTIQQVFAELDNLAKEMVGEG